MRGGWTPKRGPWARRRQFKSSRSGVYGAYAFVFSTGAYSFTGIAANLLKGSDLAAAKGTYTYTGIAATLSWSGATPTGQGHTRRRRGR